MAELLTVPLYASGEFGFPCIVERNGPTPGQQSVITLHGLGEDRSGHNYLFTELSRHLAGLGFDVYRFDLAGCGDSPLPLHVALWLHQLESVVNLTRERGHVHVVLRGSGRCAVPDDYSNGHVVALGPSCRSAFDQGWESILATSSNGSIEPRSPLTAGSPEEAFWHNLGAEARRLGGTCLDVGFLRSLRDRMTPCPPGWSVVVSQAQQPHAPSGAEVLPTDSFLFLYEADRRALGELVAGRLASFE